MKIALISPRGAVLSKEKEFIDFWNNSKEISFYKDLWTGANGGLLTIAALTDRSIEIVYIDENYEEIDFCKQYDFVGITANTQQATRAYRISQDFRQRGVHTVLGGLHATILSDEAQQMVDTVICGESEYLWPQFLNDFRNGAPRPLYKSDKVVDLADSPIPRYDLMNPKNHKIVWVQSSRGCPYDCDFCAASKIYGKRYRCKPIDNVIKEIEFIKHLFGDKRIGFSDDNIFVNRKRAKEFLERIVPLGIRYICQTDVSISDDDDLLSLASKSGCVQVLVGLESVNQNNLNLLDTKNWKYNKFSSYTERIKKIQSFGIGVFGTFIVGLDNDDISIVDKTSEFIISNHLLGAQITILTPFPGTRLRSKLEEEKRILSSNWEDYTAWKVNYSPKLMSPEELRHAVLQIYKNIYCKEIYEKKIEYFKNIQKQLIVSGQK